MERWEERDRNVIFITARSKAGSRFLSRENYRKIVNSILSGSIKDTHVCLVKVSNPEAKIALFNGE